MSYEDNRKGYGGDYAGYDRDRDERHGQSGQRRQPPDSGFQRDEFESYPPSRDEGNVNRGGYGRDAEGPAHGGGHHGGHHQNLDDPESTGYDQPARNYSQRRQDNDNDNYNRGGRGRNDNDSGTGGHGRNEYGTQSGRQAVGSGESYVGLGNRGGDDYRATSDAYGGEGLTSGDYGSSNTHQNKPHHGSGTGYSGGNSGGDGGRYNSGGTGGGYGGSGGGGDHGGSGGYTTGNSGGGGRNEYGSSNQGTYGSMNSSNSGGNTGGSGLANWKPGQEMHFDAAEHESEPNVFAKDAIGYASETQNILKQGIKDMEKKVEGYVKDKIGGGSKHEY